MTTDFVQIYPVDNALRTPEREALYAEIREKVDLGEFNKKTFEPALQRLVFEGQVESRNERIGGPRDPMTRINPLGTHVHAYLCLASPVVSEEAFVEILRHYKEASVTDMAIELTERFDGTRRHRFSPALQARNRCLVQALRQVIPAPSFQYRYGRMFSGFLSRACYRGTTEQSLVTDCWDGVDAFVATGSSDQLDDIRNLATQLFSGEAEEPAGYRDCGVIAFCDQYFNRQFGPHLLALLDTIYQSIEPEKRLRIEQGAIVFPHLAGADIAAAVVAAAAQSATANGPTEDTGAVEGTGFFCLVRSLSAEHSHQVAQALRAALASGTMAVPPPSAELSDALAPISEPDFLQRVDDTTLLLGWQAMLDVGTGRAEVAACGAAGCRVLAAALWMESGEVVHLHGLQQGQPWRFSRARSAAKAGHADRAVQDDEEGGLVHEPHDLLALLQAEAAQSPAAPR